MLPLVPFLTLMQADMKKTDLEDGWTRVETAAYTVEIPKGWTLGKETPYGAREVKPSEGKGEMGTMTAGPTDEGWDALVRTSLGFILREKPGKATPYTLSKSKGGYEACSFRVIDLDGFAARRYTLLKAPSKKVLALSVKIPDKASEKAYDAIFKRMVDTARIAAAKGA